MRSSLDIRAMLLDLHRMRLELERELDQEQSLLTRDGSVRGRKLHVFNTIRRMRNKEQWKVRKEMLGEDRDHFQKDYIAAEQHKVVVYITSCGIHRRVWERCRDSVDLLKAHNIRVRLPLLAESMAPISGGSPRPEPVSFICGRAPGPDEVGEDGPGADLRQSADGLRQREILRGGFGRLSQKHLYNLGYRQGAGRPEQDFIREQKMAEIWKSSRIF